MALQICSFKADYSLTGIPANRIFNPVNNSSTRFILPLNKNVKIKKIALDVVYNSNGEICVLDYSLGIQFRQFNNQLLPILNPILLNGSQLGFNSFSVFLNKKNPFIDVNFEAGDFIIQSAGRGNLIQLSNNGIILSNISFLITIYYEN
jgi:hypothetical protein